MSRQKRPECVLVVDDDALLAQDISLSIAKLGYGIAGIMQSSEEALKKTTRLKPDLILMNIKLANNQNSVDAVRKIQLVANIPFIFLITNPDHEFITSALTDIPYTLLKSPLNARELELKLELALLRHPIEEQTRLTHQALKRRIYEITLELDSAQQALQGLQIERRRDQVSLRRFSNALDDSADSIYLIDRSSMHFIDINKTSCERSGYSSEELLKMSPLDIMPYLNTLTLTKEFDKISASPDRFGIIDTWLQAKNGEIYPVEVRLRATETVEGLIIVAIARDMTLNRKNEEALRLSEEKFRLLFEIAPIGLALMNSNRILTDVNPALCNMLGYSQDELVGKFMSDITYPDDNNVSMEIAADFFNGKVINNTIEKRYMKKNGEPIWARMHGTVVRDLDLNPLFGLGMIENINYIKQAEALRRAQESAQKKALVREVHHRIKNHLQGVVGLMQQHAMNNSQGSNIIELAISQINAVATIHGLQGKGSSEDIDLLQMLTAISDGLRVTYPMQIPSAITKTGICAMHLHGDESVPIALALNEIMINAAKHGTGFIEISLNCRNDYAVICVENQCLHTVASLTPGSGLELVQALVQTKGAAFQYQHTGKRFVAKIILTPPVIGVYIEP
jgi:PAS domain S-box-containing protein